MEKLTYYLSRHVFFCLEDNHYIFLDLRNDQYVCLGREQTDAIRSQLNHQQGVSKQRGDIRPQNASNPDVSAVLQALVNRGVLVSSVRFGKRLTPPEVKPPVASLIESPDKPRPRIGPVHVWRFLAAVAGASKDLRWESIERTVRKVEARKLSQADSNAADTEAISNLFTIYQTLRPYYPRRYLCLFDSLALLHFLARFRVFPQWVYGVKLEPFAAHCWVQVDSIVVNDIVDNVRDYTPIMSV